jgi:hypothetical protein
MDRNFTTYEGDIKNMKRFNTEFEKILKEKYKIEWDISIFGYITFDLKDERGHYGVFDLSENELFAIVFQYLYQYTESYPQLYYQGEDYWIMDFSPVNFCNNKFKEEDKYQGIGQGEGKTAYEALVDVVEKLCTNDFIYLGD